MVLRQGDLELALKAVDRGCSRWLILRGIETTAASPSSADAVGG